MKITTDAQELLDKGGYTIGIGTTIAGDKFIYLGFQEESKIGDLTKTHTQIYNDEITFSDVLSAIHGLGYQQGCESIKESIFYTDDSENLTVKELGEMYADDDKQEEYEIEEGFYVMHIDDLTNNMVWTCVPSDDNMELFHLKLKEYGA